MSEYNWIIGLLAVILTMLGMQAGFGAWISNQFYKVRSSVDRIQENILNKLEYHERHDDQRFQEIHRALEAIRIRNAARDGYELKRTDRCPERLDQKYLKNVENVEKRQNPL